MHIRPKYAPYWFTELIFRFVLSQQLIISVLVIGWYKQFSCRLLPSVLLRLFMSMQLQPLSPDWVDDDAHDKGMDGLDVFRCFRCV